MVHRNLIDLHHRRRSRSCRAGHTRAPVPSRRGGCRDRRAGSSSAEAPGPAVLAGGRGGRARPPPDSVPPAAERSVRGGGTAPATRGFCLNRVPQHPLLLGRSAEAPFDATQRDRRRKVTGFVRQLVPVGQRGLFEAALTFEELASHQARLRHPWGRAAGPRRAPRRRSGDLLGGGRARRAGRGRARRAGRASRALRNIASASAKRPVFSITRAMAKTIRGLSGCFSCATRRCCSASAGRCAEISALASLETRNGS